MGVGIEREQSRTGTSNSITTKALVLMLTIPQHFKPPDISLGCLNHLDLARITIPMFPGTGIVELNHRQVVRWVSLGLDV